MASFRSIGSRKGFSPADTRKWLSTASHLRRNISEDRLSLLQRKFSFVGDVNRGFSPLDQCFVQAVQTKETVPAGLNIGRLGYWFNFCS